MSQITIVFRSERGFITDFGAPLQVVGSPNLNDLSEIPRYGVWMKGPRKFEVVMTTNSLDEAKEALAVEWGFLHPSAKVPIEPRPFVTCEDVADSDFTKAVGTSAHPLIIEVERRVKERRRKTNPEERAELERMAGRPLPTDEDVDRYLFEHREDAMREREFAARRGGRRVVDRAPL